MQAARRATLADAIASASWVRDVLLIGAASALTGLLAQAEVRLPFTPVPLTLNRWPSS